MRPNNTGTECEIVAGLQLEVEAAGQSWLDDAQQLRAALDSTLSALSKRGLLNGDWLKNAMLNLLALLPHAHVVKAW